MLNASRIYVLPDGHTSAAHYSALVPPADPRPVHLVGGGWQPGAADAVYRPFVAAADGGAIVVIVEDGEGSDEYGQRFVDVLARAGARDTRVLAVGDAGLPGADAVGDAGAVVVGGGLTPRYHEALAAGSHDWLPPRGPYLGFSAGAAIAPAAALLGGWLVDAPDGRRVMSPEENAEDLDALTVRPGLGLVPWMVDVHAGHRGSLSRLVHALLAGHADTGFAIDEDTSVIVEGAAWRVAGAGFVYEVVRDGDGVRVRAHVAGRGA